MAKSFATTITRDGNLDLRCPSASRTTRLLYIQATFLPESKRLSVRVADIL